MPLFFLTRLLGQTLWPTDLSVFGGGLGLEIACPAMHLVYHAWSNHVDLQAISGEPVPSE